VPIRGLVFYRQMDNMQESRDLILALPLSSNESRSCTGRCLHCQVNVGIEQATPRKRGDCWTTDVAPCSDVLLCTLSPGATGFSNPLGSSLFLAAQAATVLLTNTDSGNWGSPSRVPNPEEPCAVQIVELNFNDKTGRQCRC
jgi:hypothetical protein